MILINVTSQPLAFFMFTYGPLPQVLCYADLIFRTSLPLITFLLLDAICIVRYLFIFHLKNPTANQHNFWTFFICFWAFSFSFTGHFIFAMLPGNNPNFFYICLGKFPASHSLQKTKVNWFLIDIALLTILVHIFVGFRYWHFKHQEKFPSQSAQQAVTSQHINKSSLASLTTNFCGLLLIIMASTTAQKVNLMDKTKVNDFSHYIWAYMFYLYGPVFVQCMSVFTLHTRNALLVKHTKCKLMAIKDFFCGQ